MVKIVAIILSVVITVVIIGSIGYLFVDSIINLINGQEIGQAIGTAWSNYTQFISRIFGKAHAEPDMVYDFVNKNIQVVGCTAL